MNNYIPHYGQGMVIKRSAGRPIAKRKRSKFSLEDRLDALEKGDADTLIAIAQEYAERDKPEMCAMCLKYAEQFTGMAIDTLYAPRTEARTSANE